MQKESVWDYPRPPRTEACTRRVRVTFGGETIADSERAVRVLETSHAPVYYIPRADVRMEFLHPSKRKTMCEFKGQATYWSIRVNDKTAENAAWSYEVPLPLFKVIEGYLAFYASRMDSCCVGDEVVLPQPSEFYGGWITPDIEGPFKI